MQLFKHRFSILSMTSRYTDGSHNQGNPHTKFYNVEELKGIFEKAGFSRIRVEILYNPSDLDTWPCVRLGIGKYLPESIRKWIGKRLGLGVLVTAKKPF